MRGAVTESYTVTAPVWLWNSDKGSWHFLTISGEDAVQLRFESVGMRGGFGSIRIVAKIGVITWTTSVFPSGDDYLLPIKADVRRRAGIRAGDTVCVTLQMA